jgi:hypothetical protein
MMEMGVDEGNRAKDPKGVKICAEIQAAERYFEELGSGYGWPYEDVDEVKAAFIDLIVDATEKYVTSPAEFTLASLDEAKIKRFRDAYRDVCAGEQPTQYCGDICGEEPCLYRFNMKEAISDDYYGGRFIEIIEEGGEEMWSNLFDMCLEAVQGAILPDGGEDATRRIALCYALHKCSSIKSFNKRHIDTVMGSLIEYSEDEDKGIKGGG